MTDAIAQMIDETIKAEEIRDALLEKLNYVLSELPLNGEEEIYLKDLKNRISDVAAEYDKLEAAMTDFAVYIETKRESTNGTF